MNMIQV